MLRKIKGSKYNRLIITLLLILLQLGWISLLYLELYYNYTFIPIFVSILAAVFVLYIIQKDDNPSIKMGWIMIILVLPVLGVPLYFFYGDGKPTKQMYKRVVDAHLVDTEKVKQPSDTVAAFCDLDKRAYSTSKYIYDNSGFPVYRNTQVKYYRSGEAMFSDMLTALSSAKHYIFLEYFVIEDGEMWNAILSILMEKANEGIEIKVIYDDVGSIAKDLHKNFDKYMESLHPGIKCLKFNPMRPLAIMSMNNRDHRKLMIIDGEIGFTGGVNIADEYINKKMLYGHWKDSGIRLRGDAVRNMTLMFAELWNAFHYSEIFVKDYLRPDVPYVEAYSDGYVQPFSDCPFDKEYLSKNIIIDMVSRAKDRAYIFTPYLIIDSELREILCIAAKRGIDVRIVTPGTPDKKIVYRLTRANYRPLFDAGVKIYEYTPGFLHAKSVLADDDTAMIGSVNFDYRSMYLHFECGVYLYGSECINALEADCIDVFDKSHQITHDDLKRGIFWQTVDSILRAFETLL